MPAPRAQDRLQHLCRSAYEQPERFSEGQQAELLRHLTDGADPWRPIGRASPKYREPHRPALAWLLAKADVLPADFIAAVTHFGVDPLAPHWVEHLWAHVPLSTVHSLITQGADVTPISPQYTLAHRCVRDGARPGALDLWATLTLLPDFEAWAHHPSSSGGTLWHQLSCRNYPGHPSMALGQAWADALTPLGLDLNHADHAGTTALMNSAFRPVLLAQGAGVDLAGQSGLTALHYAARQGRLSDLGDLVAAGADVNARTHTASTPLHLAVVGCKALATRARQDRHGGEEQQQRIEALLALGANPSLLDHNGQTAQELAEATLEGGAMWARMAAQQLEHSLSAEATAASSLRRPRF